MERNHPKDPPKNSELILYQTEDGKSHLEVRFEGDTVWLTQKQMADLFQKDVRTINEHLRNVFHEGELQEDSVIRKFRITAADGKELRDCYIIISMQSYRWAIA